MFVVLPPEGDVALLQRDQPLIGDGHAMGRAGQILQDMLGGREGLLGVDDPLGGVERGEERVLENNGTENPVKA